MFRPARQPDDIAGAVNRAVIVDQFAFDHQKLLRPAMAVRGRLTHDGLIKVQSVLVEMESSEAEAEEKAV